MKEQVTKRMRHAFSTLVALAIAATAAFAFTSCLTSNDDEDNTPQYPAEIIGQWRAVNQTVKVQEERLIDGKATWVDVSQTTNPNPGLRYDIQSNGVMVQYERPEDIEDWTEKARGYWAYYNECLLFAPTPDERIPFYVPEITTTTLQLVLTEITTGDDDQRIATTTATVFVRYMSGSSVN